MASLPVSRDGRTALFIVLGGFVAAIALMIGLASLSGWLVDTGESEIGQIQTD